MSSPTPKKRKVNKLTNQQYMHLVRFLEKNDAIFAESHYSISDVINTCNSQLTFDVTKNNIIGILKTEELAWTPQRRQPFRPGKRSARMENFYILETVIIHLCRDMQQLTQELASPCSQVVADCATTPTILEVKRPAEDLPGAAAARYDAAPLASVSFDDNDDDDDDEDEPNDWSNM